jgi:hypothetical protein
MRSSFVMVSSASWLPWLPRFCRISLLVLGSAGGSAFVNCYVFGFVTLDEILWRFPRGVTHISFEFRIGSDFLDDESTNPTSLRIPSHVITDLECFRHCGHPNPIGSAQ